MSEIRVTNVLGENGNSPVNFTKGINMSGIVTATSFVPSQGQFSHRNKIINGGMNVSQRQTSSTNSSVFVVDRFKAEVTQMDQLVQTLEQSSDSPDGFGKSIKITTTTPETSIASNEQFRIQTKLEGQDFQDLEYGGSSAKTITISFYVKASVTGTFGFTVFRSESTNRVITAPYTISSADTWERKIITIPGDTAGAAITNDNAERFRLMWGLAAGSDYTTASASWGNYSSANLLGGHVTNTLVTTDNATWQLAGVQLEVGSVATPFEHRSFADELTRCSRYLQIFHVPTSNSKRASNITATVHGAGNGVYLNVAFIHPMRVAPSVTVDGAFGGNVFTGGWSGDTLSSITAEYETDALSTLGFNGITSASISGSGRTVGLTGQIYTANNGSNDAALIYSAEL